MKLAILRLPVVCERLDARSTTYRNINKGLMVPPVKLSERSSGWPAHEVDAILAARIAGCSDTRIKALVIELLHMRGEIARLSDEEVKARVAQWVHGAREPVAQSKQLAPAGAA